MRRGWIIAILAVLLLWARQAAWVHEVAHLTGGSSAGPYGLALSAKPDRTDIPEAAYCEKCFEFAHVAGAIAGGAMLLPRVVAQGEAVADAPPASIAAEPIFARNRGPPAIL